MDASSLYGMIRGAEADAAAQYIEKLEAEVERLSAIEAAARAFADNVRMPSDHLSEGSSRRLRKLHDALGQGQPQAGDQ